MQNGKSLQCKTLVQSIRWKMVYIEPTMQNGADPTMQDGAKPTLHDGARLTLSQCTSYAIQDCTESIQWILGTNTIVGICSWMLYNVFIHQTCSSKLSTTETVSEQVSSYIRKETSSTVPPTSHQAREEITMWIAPRLTVSWCLELSMVFQSSTSQILSKYSFGYNRLPFYKTIWRIGTLDYKILDVPADIGRKPAWPVRGSRQRLHAGESRRRTRRLMKRPI